MGHQLEVIFAGNIDVGAVAAKLLKSAKCVDVTTITYSMGHMAVFVGNRNAITAIKELLKATSALSGTAKESSVDDTFSF